MFHVASREIREHRLCRVLVIYRSLLAIYRSFANGREYFVPHKQKFV
jgi:hypothetical protein